MANFDDVTKLNSLPEINISRSRFDRSHSHITTFAPQVLVPLMVDDILPGDTCQLDLGAIVRQATPIFPTMGEVKLDISAFFVPYRLVWEHLKNFFGESDDEFSPTPEYEIPQIIAPANGWKEGSLADYFGFPTKVGGYSVSALPFRGYCQICKDWYRDENLMKSPYFPVDDSTVTGSNGDGEGEDIVNALYKGGLLYPTSRPKDYFGGALPFVQKGPAVNIPLGEWAPVQARWSEDGLNPVTINDTVDSTQQFPYSVSIVNAGGGPSYDNSIHPLVASTNAGRSRTIMSLDPNVASQRDGSSLGFNNLWANLTLASSATISALRQSYSLQAYYEALGTYGSRYIEYVEGIFNVKSSDARLQRAEFLGGVSVPINIDTVVQQSSTDSTSPLGTTGAFSYTPIAEEGLVNYSAEEHGMLFVVATARTVPVYQQGINRSWLHKKVTDFYNPYFAHLSAQPILSKEIYCDGSADDELTFGFTNCFDEYRFFPNQVTGLMRSNADQSLDAWHYADFYNERPKLSADWLTGNSTPAINRTIAVPSEPAFIGDFYFKYYHTRPMPTYGIPGLATHL